MRVPGVKGFGFGVLWVLTTVFSVWLLLSLTSKKPEAQTLNPKPLNPKPSTL